MRFADVEGLGMTMPPQPTPGSSPGIPSGHALSLGDCPHSTSEFFGSSPEHQSMMAPRLPAAFGHHHAHLSSIFALECPSPEVML